MHLHTNKEERRISFSLSPLWDLVSVDLLILVFLSNMKWFLVVGLIGLIWGGSHVEYVSKCSWTLDSVQCTSWNWALLWILFLVIFLGTSLEGKVPFSASQAFWIKLGFLGGLVGKESACYAGDLGSVLGLGSSPGEGNGNPLQYSCLEDPMDRRAWQATVHGVTKSWTRLNY